MAKDLLLDTAFGDIRIAVLEDGELAEFHVEKPDNGSPLGNIYRGKVERVLPGMQSAFIDIGLSRNAFLHIKDLLSEGYRAAGAGTPAIEDLLKAGQELTVQVIKDMSGQKGPRVTTRISLPGHFAVLLPGRDTVDVSKRVKDDRERERLMELASGLKPEGAGILFRTAAAYVPENLLREEVRDLAGKWESILQQQSKGPVPRCLYSEPDFVIRLIREHLGSGLDRIIVNDRELWQRINQLADSVSSLRRLRVEYFEKGYDMFEYYHVESAISRALSRKVMLKSGGYLIFDTTEALTVIDVNSGKYVGRESLEETALKINKEAAEMIARQIRIRDIGGIIIIDFIDMKEEPHRQEVVAALREAVKRDRTQTVVVGMTNLGLVEMTRKKVRQPLASYMTAKCRSCGGTGRILSPETAAARAEKRIIGYMPHCRTGHLEVQVHPEIYRVLVEKRKEALDKACGIYGCSLELLPSPDVHYEDVRLAEGR